MRTLLVPRRFQSGSTLAMVIVIGGIMGVIIAATLGLSSFSLRSAHTRSDWNAAFFHAENAVQWAAQNIADTDPATASNYFATASGTLTLGYANTANGVVTGYLIKLDSVQVGDIVINQVDASVHESGLDIALLGMAFLNRTEMRREGMNMTLTKRY